MADVVQLGVVAIGHGLQKQLDDLLHDEKAPFVRLAVRPAAGAYMGPAQCRISGVFSISLSIDLSGSMGVS